MAGGLLLALPGGSPRSQLASTTALTTPGQSQVSLNRTMVGVSRSLVVLTVDGGGGSTTRSAVAVAPGGFVATTASGLSTTTLVTAVVAGGARVGAAVVATDPGSDIALVRLARSLPVPHFVDDGALRAGSSAASVGLAQSGNRVHASWSVDTVRAVARPLGGDRGSGMAGIDTTGDPTRHVVGDVLVDGAGGVMGIEDTDAPPSPGGGQEAFLPSALVLGVASELATSGHVVHGWLGVKGRSHNGALVVGLDPSGPSAGRLRTGDVILSINGEPVRTMAELRSRLYILAPGRTAQLAVMRQGIEREVSVVLARSP